MDLVADFVAPALLVALRVTPVLAFAPPFTLVRLPTLVRLLIGLGLSASLVSGAFAPTHPVALEAGALLAAAARELLLGALFVLVFQLAFGAIYIAGRAVDIQAGFGLALLIDPTSRAQTPLIGTLFAYAAGIAFFAVDGHLALVRLFAASLEEIPLGTAHLPSSIEPVAAFATVSLSIAVGAAGVVTLMLFVADVAIAFLSRTVPQMNVLVLGFQVKTFLLLGILATSFGITAALLARLMAYTLSSLPGLI